MFLFHLPKGKARERDRLTEREIEGHRKREGQREEDRQPKRSFYY